MAADLPAQLVADTAATLRKYKALAEGALEQVDDAALHRALDEESNSLAVIVRHMAGNMRSRSTDFLTTDGEKPSRDRDGEFEPRPLSRAELLAEWEDGWRIVFDAVDGLRPEDLLRTVRIRGEPMTASAAITRQLAHYSYHVGQIVYLARHLRRGPWRSLSIPRARPDAGGA